MNPEIIIVRNKITERSKLFSDFLRMTVESNTDSINHFVNYYGYKKIFEDLLQEEMDNHNDLYDSKIYKKFMEAREGGKDNELFQVMYKIKGDMAVKLTEHIHIYHIVDLKIGEQDLVPWRYADSKNYICDTWWDSDEAILRDMNNLPYVEFLVKYRAY